MKLILMLVLIIFSLNLYASDLQVGIATTDVTPDISEKIPLGGYGGIIRRNWPFHLYNHPIFRMFKIATGKLDPIRAKAMVLKRGDKKLLFVGLDVVGVTRDFHTELLQKLSILGFDETNIFISGTHTHSGPGALSKSALWEIIAMDRFQKKFYNKFIGQIVDTVVKAIYKLEKASLYTVDFDTHGLQNNRRGSHRPLNPNAKVLLAKSANGNWLGGLVNFAVHGTSLGEENLNFSSDAPGAIEREMEDIILEKNNLVIRDNRPEMIFINGAEGDVSPKLDYLDLGKEFASQFSNYFDDLRLINSNWEVHQLKVKLGKPKFNLSKCANQRWLPKNINMGVKKWVNPNTTLTHIRFDDFWMMTWPGEATTELGMKLKEIALNAGAKEMWFLGLTNDHYAYFLTPDEYEVGGYEACSSFFGKGGGEKVLSYHEELSRAYK